VGVQRPPAAILGRNVMDERNVAVVLMNGRSHMLDVPEGMEAAVAAAVVRGERSGSDAGWSDGEARWLSFGQGQGWLHRDSIAEIVLVDYADDASFSSHVYD